MISIRVPAIGAGGTGVGGNLFNNVNWPQRQGPSHWGWGNRSGWEPVHFAGSYPVVCREPRPCFGRAEEALEGARLSDGRAKPCSLTRVTDYSFITPESAVYSAEATHPFSPAPCDTAEESRIRIDKNFRTLEHGFLRLFVIEGTPTSRCQQPARDHHPDCLQDQYLNSVSD
jgi:hypothetical protein